MKSKPILRCWAEIDHRALRENLSFIRKQIPQTTEVMGMVKANAYGHCAVAVAKTLWKEGVRSFGVASLAEALSLKEHGVRGKILILGAALIEEYPQIVRHQLIATISSFQEGKRLNEIAKRQQLKAIIHFKIDTGMGRLGAWWEEAEQELLRLSKLSHLEIGGIYTHFSSADSDEAMTREQIKRFLNYRPWFEKRMVHASNSAGVLGKQSLSFDCIRPGISLYGYAPLQKDQKHLKPVLSWKTRVTAIHQVKKGRTLSYGATYRVTKDSTIALLAVGYADGYPRLLSNQGSVLIQGKRVPIRGRVTMDQILVDVTTIGKVSLGEEVTLIGGSGKNQLLATELAEKTGTISYEILCGISDRVLRIHRHA